MAPGDLEATTNMTPTPPAQWRESVWRIESRHRSDGIAERSSALIRRFAGLASSSSRGQEMTVSLDISIYFETAWAGVGIPAILINELASFRMNVEVTCYPVV